MRLEGGSVIDVAAGSTAEDRPSAADVVVYRDRPRGGGRGRVARICHGTVRRSGSVGDGRWAATLNGQRAVCHRDVYRESGQ